MIVASGVLDGFQSFLSTDQCYAGDTGGMDGIHNNRSLVKFPMVLLLSPLIYPKPYTPLFSVHGSSALACLRLPVFFRLHLTLATRARFAEHRRLGLELIIENKIETTVL